MAAGPQIKALFQKKILGVPAPLIIGGGLVIVYLGYRYYKNRVSSASPQAVPLVPQIAGGSGGGPVSGGGGGPAPDFSGAIAQIETGLSTVQGNLLGINAGLLTLQNRQDTFAGQIAALQTAQPVPPAAAPAVQFPAQLPLSASGGMGGFGSFGGPPVQQQPAQSAAYTALIQSRAAAPYNPGVADQVRATYAPIPSGWGTGTALGPQQVFAPQPQPYAASPYAQQSFVPTPQNTVNYPSPGSAHQAVQQIYNPYTGSSFGVGSIQNAPNPYGPNAAPQVIQPQVVQSRAFGSGSNSFTVPGHYVGDPNGGGAVWVAGY